jgi:hypothetical protein
MIMPLHSRLVILWYLTKCDGIDFPKHVHESAAIMVIMDYQDHALSTIWQDRWCTYAQLKIYTLAINKDRNAETRDPAW